MLDQLLTVANGLAIGLGYIVLGLLVCWLGAFLTRRWWDKP